MRLSFYTKLILAGALLSGAVSISGPAVAGIVVAPGFSLSVFAAAPPGSSAPDSIAVVGSNVFVGFGNGGKPDGSGGAMSTIAEFNSAGAFLGSTTLAGHNDGLRYNAQTGLLWSLQNEDGNPNLVLINPHTLAASAALPFSSTPHGGGYDDIAFGPHGAFVSASNPANNPNTGPAIVSVKLGGPTVHVTGSVLSGNATVTDLNTGGTTTLNLQDPDSLIFAPNGQFVLDSQSDKQLVFISNPATGKQSVGVLNLANAIDDTVFGNGKGGRQTLLFSDRNSGTIYRLTGNFAAGQAISAAADDNFTGTLNLANGSLDPLVSGLDSPHGEAFLRAVPELGTWAMMILGFGLVAFRLRGLEAMSLA
jgi:hypothetical protein